MAVTASGFYFTGTQQSITIVNNATSQVVTLGGNRTKFSMDPKEDVLSSDTVDNGGRVVHKKIPGGWTGSIEVEKGSTDFDDLYALLDASYYAGLPDTYFTITETMPSTADSTAGPTQKSYQYTLCVIHGYKPGDWMRKDIVKASLSISATERLAV